MPVRNAEYTHRSPTARQRLQVVEARRLRWASCLVIGCMLGHGAVAADPDPSVAPPIAAEAVPGLEATTPVADPEKLADQPTESPPLPEAGAVPAALSEAEELLDSALAAMDQAVLELEADDPTPAAVESQQLAVDRLQELLDAASQSQSPPPPSSKNPKPQPSDSSDSSKQQSSQSGASDSKDSGSRRADDENSKESTENVAGPPIPGSGVLAPGARANSVWGHLPAREQEALLRSLSDSFLPEYEAQIRRYYEALAERK